MDILTLILACLGVFFIWAISGIILGPHDEFEKWIDDFEDWKECLSDTSKNKIISNIIKLLSIVIIIALVLNYLY